MENKILIVDDEADILDLIEIYLKREGLAVVKATSAIEALTLTRREKPELILLDILLPGMDGFEICRLLRQETLAPIIFLSSRSDESDKILGLGLGADDYLTKPFSPLELVARVKANLRRFNNFEHLDSKKNVKYPGLELDLEAYLAKIDSKLLKLSVKEFELLKFLATHPNRVFTPEQIYTEIWGADSTGDYRVVGVYISKLRDKLAVNPVVQSYVKTVWGIGYKFEES